MAKAVLKDIPSNSGARCVAYWTDPSANGETQAKLLFDPWSSIDGAYTIHGHRHTKRAEHIHENFVRGHFTSGDVPDFTGQTVYIFGRGSSLAANAATLSRRKSSAIFLNHSTGGLRPNPGDFIMAIDPDTQFPVIDKKVSLIASAAIPADIVGAGWANAYGVNMREPAPLNLWAQKIFPNLPLVSECLSVTLCALHYVAMCGAKNIICCGMDFCTYTKVDEATEDGLISLNGDLVFSEMHYLYVTMAAAFMVMFIQKHTGARVVNASGQGLFGMNVHRNNGDRFDWVEQIDISSAIDQMDNK